MTARFCPDCGIECQHQDTQCPDCAFPLELEIQTSLNWQRFKGINVQKWNRIAQLLMKNGIVIQSRPATDWEDQKFWWIFPGAGLLVLLSTFLFGPSLANWIWPIRADQEVLTLDQNPIRAKIQDPNQPEINDPPEERLPPAARSEPPVPETTQEPGDDLSELTPPLTESDFGPAISLEEAESILADCAGRVRLEGQSSFCALVGTQGAVLAPANLLVNAFKRENKLVSDSGSLEEKAVVLVPAISLNGRQVESSQMLAQRDSVPFVLLETDLNLPATIQIEAFRPLSIDDRVYFISATQPMQVESAKVVSDRFDAYSGLRLFHLSSSFGDRLDGSPVLTEQGKLIGCFMTFDDQDCVVVLTDLVNKMPEAYPYLHGD
ncbi:MAG: hypothetical protein H6510_00050 [Acidobacteria bacterium]|nr:hypothetical protein [Acidobacteriota bacterium]MCB9396178.1 hypothetical protein [Acidobacteriota bacterium]